VVAANRKCGAFPEIACDGINLVSNTQWAQRVPNKDANKECYPSYSRRLFNIRQSELGLVDPKSDAGLCTISFIIILELIRNAA
jgi:hypothetical protein